MNEIVNRFLLAGDKFMPEMHLKQSGFTYSTCRLFTKSKERIHLAEKLLKPIIKKLKKEEFILHLKTIFGMLILLICN